MPPCAPSILSDVLPARRILGPTAHLPQQVDPQAEFTNFIIPFDEVESFLTDQLNRVNWNEVNNSVTEKTRRATNRSAKGAKSRGPYQTKYEFIRKYECDHSGLPRRTALGTLDPNRKRARKESIKVGCTARFFLRKKRDSDEIEVEFHPRHNHETGTPQAMADSRMSKETRDWLRSLAQRGFQWSTIKTLLRESEGTEVAIDLDGSGSVPQNLHVGYQDAYNYVRTEIVKASRKDQDGWKSLENWKSYLEEKQGKEWRVFMRDDIVGDGDTTWAFGMICKWQAERLRLYGQLVCMDSTHNTSFSTVVNEKEKSFLYTLVVKSRETGKGVPVCWMFTPRETRYPIVAWLKWLQSEFDWFRPQYFMLDCSVTEAAAIGAAFEEDLVGGVPKPRILWCWFHLFKAVRAKATKCGRTPEEGAELFADFMVLVNAKSDFVFEVEWIRMRSARDANSEWIKYLSSFALPVRDRWAQCGRIDLPYGINTNNIMEKWHHNLKTGYLGHFRSQRSDFLVFILSDCVLPDYTRDEYRIRLGFDKRRTDKTENNRKVAANSLDETTATEMIEIDVFGNIYVSSFTIPERNYKLSFVLPNSLLACECPDFLERGNICKHLFLAARITKWSISTRPPQLDPPSTDLPSSSASSLSNLQPPRPPRDLPPSQEDHETVSIAHQLVEKSLQIAQSVSHLKTLTPANVSARHIDREALENALSHAESALRALNSQNQPLYAHQRR